MLCKIAEENSRIRLSNWLAPPGRLSHENCGSTRFSVRSALRYHGRRSPKSFLERVRSSAHQVPISITCHGSPPTRYNRTKRTARFPVNTRESASSRDDRWRPEIDRILQGVVSSNALTRPSVSEGFMNDSSTHRRLPRVAIVAALAMPAQSSHIGSWSCSRCLALLRAPSAIRLCEP